MEQNFKKCRSHILSDSLSQTGDIYLFPLICHPHLIVNEVQVQKANLGRGQGECTSESGEGREDPQKN